MSQRTITLTNRPPVKIEEDNWPVIASAHDSEHDGQVECQANCKSKWFVGVRQHGDGRTLVYATYNYTSNWQGARDYSAKRGVLLAPLDAVWIKDEGRYVEPSDNFKWEAALVATIREVCGDIATAECSEGDAARWNTLAAECIADLPADEI